MGLSETTEHLAMANSVRWYGHVMRREDSHILKRALDFDVKGQTKKWRVKRTYKKQDEQESEQVGLRREDALCSGVLV